MAHYTSVAGSPTGKIDRCVVVKYSTADISASLDALGADSNLVDREEHVFRCLVETWKRLKTPPEIGYLARLAGVERSCVGRSLSALVNSGRVAKLRKGVYVPIISRCQANGK